MSYQQQSQSVSGPQPQNTIPFPSTPDLPDSMPQKLIVDKLNEEWSLGCGQHA